MADVVGAENSLEISTLKADGAVIDDNRLVSMWLKGIHDINFPGPDDSLVLVLGALEERIVLILRQLRKTGTPTDIDENRQQAAAPGSRQRLLCVGNRAVFFNLPAQILSPHAFGIANAVLPVQHQQCGLRGHALAHITPQRTIATTVSVLWEFCSLELGFLSTTAWRRAHSSLVRLRAPTAKRTIERHVPDCKLALLCLGSEFA